MNKTHQEIIQIALETIRTEGLAVNQLLDQVDENFALCVETILRSKGRLIVTGIGKSAVIGSKIVATLNSTGTPAIFMHAADAIHGDLGIIQKDDIILCISNSGNTPEIKVLIPYIKLYGNTLIGMIGNKDSYLARQSDLKLMAAVEKEACPNNLAPTSSTTVQLVMGDALAVSLLECRGFTTEDFAKYHPGGALGKKLFMRVTELYKQNEKPQVESNAKVGDAIIEISSKRLGATAVMDGGKLVGMITDGDLRRMMQTGKPIENLRTRDIMNPDPKTIKPDRLVAHALDIMRSNNITQLLVEDDGQYLGVIHLHDILREGIL